MNQKFVNLNQLSYKITKHGLKFLVENGIIKVDYKDDEIFVCEKDIKSMKNGKENLVMNILL